MYFTIHLITLFKNMTQKYSICRKKTMNIKNIYIKVFYKMYRLIISMTYIQSIIKTK